MSSGLQQSTLGRTAVIVVLLLLSSCGPSRADEFDRIAEALALEPGMKVADVGAGDGEWSLELARYVGADGFVYATEVERNLVDDITELFAREGVENAVGLLGGENDAGLEAECCDAILLRMVYHHFTRPEPMRRSLYRALKSGALLAVIDIYPQENWRKLPGVPERGGHGITPEDLIVEMTAASFELVARVESWNDDDERFCVVFRRGAEGGIDVADGR